MQEGKIMARLDSKVVWGASLATALLFAFVTALVCRHGAEVPFVDSLNYFRFSQSGHWGDLPVIHGIGYALYLSVFAHFCSSLQAATAWANVLAGFVFATIFSHWMVCRFGRKGVLVALGVLGNIAILEDYGAALSESLFMAFLIGTFASLAAYDRTKKRLWLTVSGFAMAAACLTRYAGLAFLGSACLALWLGASKRIRGFGTACAYGGASVAPLAMVMVVNQCLHGNATAHVAGFHPAGLNEWADGCSTVCSWLMPDRTWLAIPFLAPVVGFVILATSLFFCIRGGVTRHRETMLWAFPVIAHVLFLYLSYTFLDCDLGFARRLLSPMIPFLFVGLACLLERLPRFGKTILIAVFACLVCFNAQRAVPFVKGRFENGAGWWGEKWSRSPVVQAIVAISRERTVYSNAHTALVFRGCEGIRDIPWEELPVSGEKNTSFEDDYAKCIAELGSGRAILGKVDFSIWFKRTVSLERIVADAALVKLVEYEDGVIWGRQGALESESIQGEGPVVAPFSGQPEEAFLGSGSATIQCYNDGREPHLHIFQQARRRLLSDVSGQRSPYLFPCPHGSRAPQKLFAKSEATAKACNDQVQKLVKRTRRHPFPARNGGAVSDE